MPSEAVLGITDVNAMDEDRFVAAFGQVYEESPALAAAVWAGRPFVDREALIAAFGLVADELDETASLALLRAHPQLAAAGPMTATSQAEQRGAGLTDLDAQRQGGMRDDNARYIERFGFPFIIAVRGLSPADIAAALTERLDHDDADERATALQQVKRIAALRISQLVAS